MKAAAILAGAQRVLGWVLPARCLNCDALVDRQGDLCAPCWTSLRFIAAPQCVCCGLPFEFAHGDGALCGACAAEAPVYRRARSVLAYDDASRGLVLRFKHADRTDLAPAFGAWLARAGAELLREADVVAPVPLHRRRLFARRYNQSALLAVAVAKASGVPAAPMLLARTRNTPIQGGLSRNGRLDNVRGAFTVRRPVVGRRVVLVDDVFTTGGHGRGLRPRLAARGCGARRRANPHPGHPPGRYQLAMPTKFTAACVQLTAGADIAANIAAAVAGIHAAAKQGADFIALPENAVLMPADSLGANRGAATEDAHPGVAAIAAAARDVGRWVLAGTFGVRDPDAARLSNRLVLVSPTGAITARYDKIHMFDADLPDRSYRESAVFRPGERAVVADLPWLKLGLSVCYDLRFPHLYRALAQAGAGLLVVPSAFTEPTGRAHWHVLLRARAIETGCYVVAPAQTGAHPGGRRTFGHSLIVAPWGEVVAEAGDAPGVILAEIDVAQIAAARSKLPALTHDRPFAAPGG